MRGLAWAMNTLVETIHFPLQRRKDGRVSLGNASHWMNGDTQESSREAGAANKTTDGIVTAGSAERQLPPVRQQARLPDSGAGHGENDSDENPQRFAVDHFAFPVAFFGSMGLGRPMPTVQDSLDSGQTRIAQDDLARFDSPSCR